MIDYGTRQKCNKKTLKRKNASFAWKSSLVRYALISLLLCPDITLRIFPIVCRRSSISLLRCSIWHLALSTFGYRYEIFSFFSFLFFLQFFLIRDLSKNFIGALRVSANFWFLRWLFCWWTPREADSLYSFVGYDGAVVTFLAAQKRHRYNSVYHRTQV